jgi:YesN/AraC family two-component response regulator
MWPRVLHMHEDIMEIVFIKEGSGFHLIGEKQYSVCEGDILIYNSNVLHDEYTNQDQNMSVYCCGISNLHIEGLPANHLVSQNQSYVLSSGEKREEIENLLQIMFSQVQKGEDGYEETCHYLLCALISIILQIPQENASLPREEESVLFNQIKSYIDKYYREELTLASIAKDLSISSYYLAHLFKKETGFSPIQYIMRRRIGEAQSLLINTNYNVTMIAGIVGYDNPNYFTTLFSKIVGMSPKKYRQLWSISP